ncbi:MAG TPA: hypothetical protein VNJ08_10210 [Bacteriovoracaceae bacterium]|nr:hypothetical protein [Bacteriovoracaceae bacterium]
MFFDFLTPLKKMGRVALPFLFLILVPTLKAEEEAHGVEGRSYHVQAKSKESDKQLDALIGSVNSCTNIGCVEAIIGHSIESAGTDVGEAVRTFPSTKFNECNPSFSNGVEKGITCIQGKLRQVASEKGLGVLTELRRKIYDEGKRAANFNLKLFPPQFAANVKANCGQPALTDSYDVCVSDQADSELLLYKTLTKNLENSKNVISNRATALAACSAKFTSKTCAAVWGQHFKTGFESAHAVSGPPGKAQAGDPNGSENGKSTSGTSEGTVEANKSGFKCPPYIPQANCNSGTSHNIWDAAKHWRKGDDGKLYFSAEALPLEGQELNKVVHEVGESIYMLNKVELEKEIVNRVTDDAIAKYFETVHLDGHVTGATGTSEDFALIAQQLKGRLPATGCSKVADRIDAMSKRIPQSDNSAFLAIKKKEDRDNVLAARCLSATQARLNHLERKLGFVDKNGNAIIMNRSVIRQEDIDQLTYKAALKGREAAQKIESHTGRQAAEFATETAALTGQALVNLLTDLPGVRQLLKEAQTIVDGEGLASCRGLGAITDKQCREDLREFQEHFGRANSFYNKHPALSASVTVGGKQIPAFDAIAAKNPKPSESISSACEPAMGIRQPTKDEEPSAEELEASADVRSKNGAQSVAKIKNIENLLGKLCNPARREEVAQLALGNPAFARSFFGCEQPSFGRLGTGVRGKLDEASCRDRMDYGPIACYYLNHIKNDNEVKELGGALLAIGGDLLTVATGGAGAPAFAGKAIIGGAVVGGGIGGLTGASDDETVARISLGAMFCDSDYATSIKDCKKIFEEKGQYEKEFYSPKFKAAFQGAVQGGVFGALVPGEISESVRDPGSIIERFKNRKAPSDVPQIQGPKARNIGPKSVAAPATAPIAAEVAEVVAIDRKLSSFSSKVVEICEQCPTEYQVTSRSIDHSTQHFPSGPIKDIKDAQAYARADRSTAVFADGTKIDDVLSSVNTSEKIAFDPKAKELLASGADTIAFDVEIPGKNGAPPTKVRVVTCIQIACGDDAGGVITHGVFKKGDIVSAFPICGPNILSIPIAAKVAKAVGKFNAASPLGTGDGKIKSVPCK